VDELLLAADAAAPHVGRHGDLGDLNGLDLDLGGDLDLDGLGLLLDDAVVPVEVVIGLQQASDRLGGLDLDLIVGALHGHGRAHLLVRVVDRGNGRHVA